MIRLEVIERKSGAIERKSGAIERKSGVNRA